MSIKKTLHISYPLNDLNTRFDYIFTIINCKLNYIYIPFLRCYIVTITNGGKIC